MTSPQAQMQITLTVNGTVYTKTVPVRLNLTDFLRDTLFLTGTHVGCEQGVCGSCTVLMDGVSVRSCLIFAVQCHGAVIQTVEGVGTAEGMHPVQQGLWECHGVQCGYCTPGMVMAGVELLDANPNPTREQATEAIAGNLCRCTGYQQIVDGLMRAAEIKRGQS